MLERLSGKYELHVLCAGWLSYATQAIKACGWEKYFGHRIVSSHWTTASRLGFGPDGCKDFRAVFPFYRHKRWQGCVVAVDDKDSVWHAASQAWGRHGETSAVIQIPPLLDGISKTKDTAPHILELLLHAHSEYFCAQKENRRQLLEPGTPARGEARIAQNMQSARLPETLAQVMILPPL
jgi:hypothetical protein